MKSNQTTDRLALIREACERKKNAAVAQSGKSSRPISDRPNVQIIPAAPKKPHSIRYMAYFAGFNHLGGR